MKKLFALLAVLTMALTLTPMVAPVAAQADVEAKITPESVTLVLDSEESSLTATTLTLSVTVGGVSVGPSNVSWYSSSSATVTVEADDTDPTKATVTAVGLGTATILVTFNISDVLYSAKAVVTVIEPITIPSREVTPVEIEAAQTAPGSNELTVTVTYPDNLQDIDEHYLVDGLITITGTDLTGKYLRWDTLTPWEITGTQFYLSNVTGAVVRPSLNAEDGKQYVWKFYLLDKVGEIQYADTKINSAFQVKVQSITSSDNFTTKIVLGEKTIDVKPAPVPPKPPVTTVIFNLGTPEWVTEKSLGFSDSATRMVLAVPGTISGTVSDALLQNSTVSYNDSRISAILVPQGYNFMMYVKYEDLAQYGEDGTLKLEFAGKYDTVPVNLFKITTKEAVADKVTSGQKVTITGTVAPIQAKTLTASQYKVYAWRYGADTYVASATISDTGTFSITFRTYGDEDQEYYVTVQKPVEEPVYNEAPYYTLTVTKLADVTVNPVPSTIVAGSTNNITLQLFVGDATVANHVVNATVTLGTASIQFTGTTDKDGKVTLEGIKFDATGVANIVVSVKGTEKDTDKMAPGFFGTGTAKVTVSTSAEYILNVTWPAEWKIGEKNEVTFSSPLADNPVKSGTVTVTGPVEEAVAGEPITFGADGKISLTPMGYGTLTLKVEAKLADGTKVSKTFTTTIPGYVATVDPEELVRGATQTLTVVVKDAYGNPVNNALVEFYSPVNNISAPVASLKGSATTAVNNGTYKLVVKGGSIKNADDTAYVLVKSVEGKVVAKVAVEVVPSMDITIALGTSTIVLGPKTTLSATLSAPEDLAGTVLKVYNADDEDTGILNYIVTDSGTVVVLEDLPIEVMPEEAGVYQLVAENPNHKGTATLTFVEPVITASPAELLTNATTVVTFTSSNVEDLRAVTKVTATGAISKITAKTASDVITATVVTGAAKGTGTVTFVFDSKYEFALPLTVIYPDLKVEDVTISAGDLLIKFTPTVSVGGPLKEGTPVVVTLLGNKYTSYVDKDGSVSVLLTVALPVGKYPVTVEIAGYKEAEFTLNVVEAKLPKLVVTVTPTSVPAGADAKISLKLADEEGKLVEVGKSALVVVGADTYSAIVGVDGMVSVTLKAESLTGTVVNGVVVVNGYEKGSFTLAVTEAEKPEVKTFIELAPGMDVYTINGETKFWDATPYIKEGRTMVPIRHLAEALGFKASWDFSDPANKMVFIFTAEQDPEKDKEHPFILLIIGQPTAMVNGNLVALDVAPEILNGRTMVPLRFVVETLGYKVEWLGNTVRLYK